MSLIDLCCASLPTRTTDPPEVWASNHVVMARSTDSRFYRPEFTPWFTQPLRAALDNANREICVTGPTGMGKSAFLETAVCCFLDRQPGPIMIVGQTDDDVKAWAETGLWPTIKACEPLQHRLPTARGTWRKDALIMERSPIHLTGANVSGTQSKSELVVMGDEAWLYDAGRMRDIRARLHRRWNGRALFVSQAGFLVDDEEGHVIGDDFTKATDQGEQWEWCFACPQCGDVQPYALAQLKMPEDGTAPERALACVYECANCKTQFADGPAERRQFMEASRYESMRAARIPGHHHFHLNFLALYRAPWAEGALDFLNSAQAMKQGNSLDLQQFTQKQLAEPWREELSIVRGNLDLLQEGEDERWLAEHFDGEAVPNEAKRCLMVDTQRDHFWVLPKLFLGDGSSITLGYHKVVTEEIIEEMRIRLNIPANQVYIDAGYDAGRVYSIAAKYGWIAIKGTDRPSFDHPRGNGQKPITKLFSKPKRVKAPNGQTCRLMFLASDALKTMTARFRSGEGPRWRQVSDIGERYQKHLDSEERQEILVAKTNQPKQIWVKRRHDNHSWDLECYATAFALVWNLYAE